LARKADLVVWGYHAHPYKMKKLCNRKILERFKAHDFNLWGATIFKASGMYDADLPDIDKSEQNAIGWAEVAARYEFDGVIATGWNRYWTNSCQKQPIDGALDSLFNVGVILHDGRPPEGGIKACRSELKRLGEKRVFDAVAKALLKFSSERNTGWAYVRSLRVLLATSAQDRRRVPSLITLRYLRHMKEAVARAESAATDLRKALRGLVEPVWVEHYIGERMPPLREELELLDAALRRLAPQLYGYVFKKR
jgi:hypothetical protein